MTGHSAHTSPTPQTVPGVTRRRVHTEVHDRSQRQGYHIYHIYQHQMNNHASRYPCSLTLYHTATGKQTDTQTNGTE